MYDKTDSGSNVNKIMSCNYFHSSLDVLLLTTVLLLHFILKTEENNCFTCFKPDKTSTILG